MSFLIAIFFAGQTWALGACPDSAARELARVSAAPGIVLLACGSQAGVVRDLTIYRLSGKDRERLLDGDAAMKAYRVKRAGRGFDVEEALVASTFHPFVQMRVACDGQTCAARDVKCLWKKGSTPVGTEDEWTTKFVRALNGDAQGFQDPGPAAEHSEAFATFRADLARLKTLGCL